MSFFERAWVGFGLYFVVVEGYALYLNTVERKGESKTRRTLSSIIWTLGATLPGTKPNAGDWARRGVLTLAVTWLWIHFVFGGTIV